MATVIEHEPCYIYHVRDFQEHSQILEALSLNYGALAILVNNSRRSNSSSSQGLFQPFTPLKLSLKRSKGELYYLTDYDCSESGYIFPLPQHFCAVYVNELLHHLYRGQNQDVKLFGAYVSTLEAIKNKENIEQSLRLFELTLLESMGYALTLRDDEGVLLERDCYYRFCFGAGFFKVDKDAMSAVIAQEESLKVAADHSVDPTTTFSQGLLRPTSDDSGMMFPKSKVRGRRLEDSSYSYSFNRVDTSDAYLAMAMRNGFVTEDYLQRYQELSHDFMGPVLSGEQIRDIVRCDFTLPDTVKLAKQLTGALIDRLLNGKEIVSRRLYREYAQMRNAKIRALKEAKLAAANQQQLQEAQSQAQEPSQAQAQQPVAAATSAQQAPSEAVPQAQSSSTIHEPNEPSAPDNEHTKRQLFFEAHPQALSVENDKAVAPLDDVQELTVAANRPYVSQFDYVHNCVPRDKDDAPDFLTEYLNLDSSPEDSMPAPTIEQPAAEAVTVAHEVNVDDSVAGDTKWDCAKDSDADETAYCITDVNSNELDSTEPEAPQVTADSKEISTSSKVETYSESAATESESNMADSEGSESQEFGTQSPAVDDISEKESSVISQDDGTPADETNSDASIAVSDARAVSATAESVPFKPSKAATLSTAKTAKPKASSKKDGDILKASHKKAAERAKAYAKKAADKAKIAAKREAEKAKALAKKEADKDKAAEKREAEKAKAAAKALAKKEAEKAKAAAKREAEKAKAAAKALAKKEAEKAKAAAKREAEKAKAAAKALAKKEAEKVKAAAKREAEKAKAAAKRDAAKLKEAERKAAQKAKEAERKAALKEKAKAKALAEAEAKEAEIEKEFAHSMLAMIDSGLKKRQRQARQKAQSGDES